MKGTFLVVAPFIPDSEFSIALPKGVATKNEALTATAENNVGKVSSATLFMTPADPTIYVATVIINSVSGNSMTVIQFKGLQHLEIKWSFKIQLEKF